MSYLLTKSKIKQTNKINLAYIIDLLENEDSCLRAVV